ncbi:hypothetical protein MRX96_019882 [Rhipicephalus microplus]
MIIPDGDWFCPPCDHRKLCEKLMEELKLYDTLSKKRDREELRKQRLAYVGISLDNVLKPHMLLTKRSSRKRKAISYRFKEYDEMIFQAVQPDIVAAEECAKGKTTRSGYRRDDFVMDDDYESDSDGGYGTRRAATKQVNYRELSSDDEEAAPVVKKSR